MKIEGIEIQENLGLPKARIYRGDESRGASLLEYMTLAALIALVCIISISLMGVEASKMFSIAGSSFHGNG